MPVMPTYDVIVIGAGAMGSAAAYHLTRAGLKVLLLEQFALDHQRGSSNDHTRIIRYAYRQPIYIQLVKAAYPLWFALEEEAGEQLYVKTGGIDFGSPHHPNYRSTRDTLQTMNIPHERMTPDEARRRYPQFRFEDDWEITYQADYGLLAAARCVQAHIRLAQQRGAEVMANTPVIAIKPHADSVEVITPDATYSAGKIVVTAGAWTTELLAQIGIQVPLKPMQVQLAYFKPHDLEMYSAGNFPIFISHLEHPSPYGIPSFNGTGIKVALHGGELVNKVDEINYTPDAAVTDQIRSFSRKYLPGADIAPSFTRICLYTMTPDEDFLLDVHPEHAHIVYASPCSGHGFKFSALVGSILTDLALKGSTEHDIRLFRADRFTSEAATTGTRL
jgi:monomeric sarcosine oxidase